MFAVRLSNVTFHTHLPFVSCQRSNCPNPTSTVSCQLSNSKRSTRYHSLSTVPARAPSTTIHPVSLPVSVTDHLSDGQPFSVYHGFVRKERGKGKWKTKSGRLL
jgi:hypothetical protein